MCKHARRVEARHVHIGPGRLGVGLILDVANRTGFETHVVGRPGSEASVGCFSLELTGAKPEKIRYATYSEATRLADLKEDTRVAIAADEHLLITTSVGGGMAACATLLTEIAELRGSLGAETVFIACENDPGPGYEALCERLEALGVRCRATMVNRLCPERRLKDGRMLVRADPYAEWLIGECEEATVGLLLAAPEVGLVAEVEPFATRKRWVCNGVHVALGVFARGVGQPSIKAVANDDLRRLQVDELQDDMIGALDPRFSHLRGDDAAYARVQLVPMCRTEDQTDRILKRLTRAKLAPFFEDAERKIGEPARRRVELDKDRRLPESFEEFFLELHNLVLNLEHYEDANEVKDREVALSREEDAAATAAYDRLLKGIVDDEERIRRCEQLARRLSRHHQLWGQG